MTDPLAFRGTYADWKLIKTRGVVQVVMEVPLADADAAYKVLGGMPDASREAWFAVAPLELPVHQPAKETQAPSPKSSPQPTHPPAAAKRIAEERMNWRELQPAAQAGIRCEDPVFIAFLKEQHEPYWETYGEAPRVVRNICGVQSRAELGTNHKARVLWKQLDDQFQAWKAHENA